MDRQASKEVMLVLDGKRLSADKGDFRVKDNDTLIIPKVPVGKHKLSVSKNKYKPRDDWEEFDLKSGELRNISATLELATVTLTVSTFKEARVYIGKHDVGVVGEAGILVIPDLLPQSYEVSVELFGYQTAVRQVTLELDKPPQRLDISLISLTKRNDGKDGFDPEKRVWFPKAPADWRIDKSDGMLVRGQGAAFFRDHDQLTQNIYENYTMVLRVKLSNNLGASWIIRAQDEKNYYLFELTTSRSREKERYLIFSIVRNGKPQEVHRTRRH